MIIVINNNSSNDDNNNSNGNDNSERPLRGQADGAEGRRLEDDYIYMYEHVCICIHV